MLITIQEVEMNIQAWTLGYAKLGLENPIDHLGFECEESYDGCEIEWDPPVRVMLAESHRRLGERIDSWDIYCEDEVAFGLL